MSHTCKLCDYPLALRDGVMVCPTCGQRHTNEPDYYPALSKRQILTLRALHDAEGNIPCKADTKSVKVIVEYDDDYAYRTPVGWSTSD